MKLKNTFKFLALAVSTVAFTLFTLLWLQRFNMPYNEAGRYFDGVIVFHEQGVVVYALLSCFYFATTFGIAYGIWKARGQGS